MSESEEAEDQCFTKISYIELEDTYFLNDLFSVLKKSNINIKNCLLEL